MTAKDDVVRLMSHSGGSASAYREFPGAEPTPQTSRWALLQAVEHTGLNLPSQSLPAETASVKPHAPPSGLLAQLAASQPDARPRPGAQPASSTLSIQPADEPVAVAALPEERADTFGTLFRTAPSVEEAPQADARLGSLKTLLKSIGTCR